MRNSFTICVVVAFAILGASSAPAGTLSIDFSVDQVIAFPGGPATGSARIVLTGLLLLGIAGFAIRVKKRLGEAACESLRSIDGAQGH